MCDLFYFQECVVVASYTDDTTSYSANKTNDLVIKEIDHFSEVLSQWFDFNYMKTNTGKIHVPSSGNDNVSANIGDNTIISENKTELLGIMSDSKLSFVDYISNLCKKASQRLTALARVTTYMCLEKRKTVMKAFVTSQFGYCPLVFMSHSRALNNKINFLQEKTLKLTYGAKSSLFISTIENMQALATKMFKVKNNIRLEIMK